MKLKLLLFLGVILVAATWVTLSLISEKKVSTETIFFGMHWGQSIREAAAALKLEGASFVTSTELKEIVGNDKKILEWIDFSDQIDELAPPDPERAKKMESFYITPTFLFDAKVIGFANFVSGRLHSINLNFFPTGNPGISISALEAKLVEKWPSKKKEASKDKNGISHTTSFSSSETTAELLVTIEADKLSKIDVFLRSIALESDLTAEESKRNDRAFK